jgi:hypothetical protein
MVLDTLPPPKARPGLISRITTKSYFVPIFGAALETTARRLVYRLMWGTGGEEEEGSPPFPVVGVFPGTVGGELIGFCYDVVLWFVGCS